MYVHHSITRKQKRGDFNIFTKLYPGWIKQQHDTTFKAIKILFRFARNIPKGLSGMAGQRGCHNQGGEASKHMHP